MKEFHEMREEFRFGNCTMKLCIETGLILPDHKLIDD
jgi:hypothetical protein